MSNNFDKFEILESFLDEVSSYVPEIAANLDLLQQRPNAMESIEETYRRAHTIAGSSAMMEYGALSHVAQGMEEILGNVMDSGRTLDAPTIGLLRRSATRLTRLIEHIRTGADDAPVVAEDDADHAAWRGSAAASDATQAANVGSDGLSGMRTSSPSAPLQVPGWLAAFANPGTPATEAQSASAPHQPMQPQPPQQGWQPAQPHPQQLPPQQLPPQQLPPQYSPSQQQQAQQRHPDSLLDADPWASSISNLPTGYVPTVAPSAPRTADPFSQSSPGSMDDMLQAFRASASSAYDMTSNTPSDRYDQSSTGRAFGASQQSLAAASANTSSSRAVQDLLAEAEGVRRQVASLRDVAVALSDASQAMEDERLELRGFLDGSRDALERLEDWAGQQMGLDLRHSPDAVRRYLPLSVIWATTTRLKNLSGLLTGSERNLSATQEQIMEALGEMRAAIEHLGPLPNTLSAFGATPDGGFSATVAHVTWGGSNQPTIETPTVDATHAAGEQLSAGTRAEIERDVRERLRRELEDEVRAEVAAEVRRDEQDRLRQELQVQVRRQLLAELTPNLGTTSAALAAVSGQNRPLLPFIPDHVATPVHVTSEQSPEALEVFRDEAQEHLQTITTGLAQLEAAPGDAGALQSIRRAMHTLKGAAGMMGFVVIQQLAHASEDLLDRLVEGGGKLTSDMLSLLLDTSETLDRLASNAIDDEQPEVREIMARYARLPGAAPVEQITAAARRGDTVEVGLLDDADEATTARPHADATDLSVRLQLSKLDDLVNLFGELLINRSILEERIDRLNRFVGDTVIVSERLRDVGSQLETRFEAATLPSGRSGGMTAGGRDGNGNRAANRMPPSMGGVRSGQGTYGQGFDELELDRYTEFHRLSRGLSEGVADVLTLGHEMETLIRDCQTSFARENRLSSDLQDRLLKARLVPLQSLVPRLYRAARASALKEGKEIEFFSDGATTEVDRKVFEEVGGPLLHLVRNSVNHGIERPAVREQAGKPRAGKITVSAAYEGNQVVISVRDDGAGIDPEHIRGTAIARGWIDAYAHLTEKEAINLIFQAGVSTAESLTEESGRGVGLDVVRDAVTRLRGTIEVESVVGQGTVFTMKFPISLQIARAVLVKVGTQTLAIPMALVEQIGRLDYYQRVPGAQPAIELRGERYLLAHLGSYLRLPQGTVGDRSSVLLVNASKRRVALVVDAIVAQQEIVLKPLGSHLRDVPGIAGASILGNGEVVLILELLELLAQQPSGTITFHEPRSSSNEPRSNPLIESAPVGPLYGGTAPLVMPSTAPSGAIPTGRPVAGNAPFVVAQRRLGDSATQRVVVGPDGQRRYTLVVDDSPSVRRVVSNMLKAHGWEVQTARDGVEALEVIARQMPAAVLLDIEMPRMDGYELMATVRSQEQYRHLPLIVLTSRAATKHQQRALQLGADAYVVKPYQDEELLTTIATLVQARQA